MTHPYECPDCGTAIQATNIEYLYDEYDHVVPSELVGFDLVLTTDKRKYQATEDREQLFMCPNEDCRIVRLFPGENE